MGTRIDFNQPIEAIVMELARRVENMETDLYADGIQPGALKRLDTFLTRHETQEVERARAEAARDEEMADRHRANRWRLNLIITLVGIGIPAAFALATLWKH